MPTNPSTTARLEIYIPIEVTALLNSMAKRMGTSASKLAAQAISELVGSSQLASIDRRLAAIEERLEMGVDYQRGKEASPKPALSLEEMERKRKDQPKILFESREPLVAGEAIGIHDLMARFGPSRGLKARLCLVGGTDGQLFNGDLARAEKVATMTIGLDPKNLPWMPVDAARMKWIQLDAKTWVRQILSR